MTQLTEELSVLRGTVPIRGNRVTVLTSDQPLGRLFVTARADGEWSIYGDARALRSMALWSSLATDLKDCVIWIAKSGHRVQKVGEGFESCDLVLCHHSLQFKSSQWKTARSYFKNPIRETRLVQIPDESFEAPRVFRKRKPTPGMDVADFHLHANTVFITSSRLVFRLMASCFARLDGATATGAHTHLFNRAREEHLYESKGDLTMCFVADEDWEAGHGLAELPESTVASSRNP